MRHEAADHAGPEDRDTVARQHSCIPDDIEGGLHVGGQHRAFRRQAVGQHDQFGSGGGEEILMRMKAEDELSRKRAVSVLDPADRRIAVLDGEGELAAHVGPAHALEFARRHAAVEDEVFRAPADAAEERAHKHLALGRFGKRLRPQFACARGTEP